MFWRSLQVLSHLHNPFAEESSFGLECLRAFKGNTIFHVGETIGETLSSDPWGQVSVGWIFVPSLPAAHATFCPERQEIDTVVLNRAVLPFLPMHHNILYAAACSQPRRLVSSFCLASFAASGASRCRAGLARYAAI